MNGYHDRHRSERYDDRCLTDGLRRLEVPVFKFAYKLFNVAEDRVRSHKEFRFSQFFVYLS